MEVYIFWGSVGLLALFLIVGFLTGLVRGLKRSSLHLIFFVASMLLAFFITKPITNAVLNIKIPVGETPCTISEYIINMIQTNFDISAFGTAQQFLMNLPTAIVSPFVFMILTILCSWVMGIIYLIVARIAFGKKKKDFEKHKPYRAYGALIGLVESFMFMFIIFAPITSLTNTYAEIASLNNTTEVQALESGNAEQGNSMKTIGEIVSGSVPKEVNEILLAYNNSVVGKISGAAGIDNAMFDYLSNFKLNGENIEFRKELISMTDVYDEFVVVYNNVISSNFQDIDMTNFKTNIESFLNQGMFKTLVADTVNDLVVHFDEIKETFGLTALPQMAQDIIADLQTTFSQEDFNTYEYLKHDIMKIVDMADNIFKKDLITKYQNISDKSFEGILNFVDTNSDDIGIIAKDVFKLNLIKDSFNTLGQIASDKVEEMFKNEEGLEVAINTNINDKDQMVNDILDAVDSFMTLNKKLNISDLLSSDDIISTITNIDDLSGALTSAGQTFDDLRNLEILTLPVTADRAEKVYVFDNILKLYNMDLLGDEVYLTKASTTKTKLETYTAFFNYLKTPIVTARDLGLTNIGKDGVTFDDILDNVTEGLKNNEDLLCDIMLPFYQLSAMDLKTLVFDNVIDQLSSNVSLIDLADVKTEDDYHVWASEFGYIGKTLNSLNRGDIEGKTYLKYMLQGSADLEEVMKAMIADNSLSSMLDPVFTAKSFKTLTKDIFDNIDSSISSLTGSTVVTFADKANLSKLEDSALRTKTIATINNLLGITLNNDLSANNENALTLYGEVLEILRADANNNGTKDGVFNEVFTHVIWYLTGDNISSDANKFDGLEANSNAEEIKKYIGISDPQEYYTYENFEGIMAEIQDVLDFSDTLKTGLDGISISDTENYATKVKEIIDAMDKMEAAKVETIQNMQQMLESTGKSLLSNEEHTQYDSILEEAIKTQYGEESAIGTALINLFKYNPTTAA